MTQALPARDRLLSLIESEPRPLLRSQIGAMLGWTRVRVSQVLTPLVSADVVAEFHVPAWRAKGHRPHVYTLEQRAVVPAAARRALRPDTIAMTPMGREVRVLCIPPDGFVEVELLGVAPRSDAFTELWWTMLRPFQAGRLPPKPVRIGVGATFSPPGVA